MTGRMMMRNIGWIGAASLALVSWGAQAQPAQGAGPTGAETQAVQGGGAHPVLGAQPPSVESCWAEWKARENLQDGKNQRKDYFVFVSHSQTAVDEVPGSRNWLTGRNAAFSLAEINARKALAESIRSTIASSRSSAVQIFGGDDAPPSLRQTVERLSLADKSRVLADKALDDEIRKYDPNWSGGNPQARQAAALKLQARLDQQVSRSTDLFASGAFTAIQCEGPSEQDGGKYSVLTGLIWTPKLAGVAETIWNRTLSVSREAPRAPLRQQLDAIAAANPDWLSYTLGARVFTDENGERVIVGFGVAPQTSLMAADRSRANLAAMASIQRFVGERIVASAEAKEGYEKRELRDGTLQSFDVASFQEKVSLEAKTLDLKGASEILSWRGEHPWSKARMQVVAVAWSRGWATDAEAVGRALAASERRMERQGGVPGAVSADAAAGGAPTAAPVRAGAAVSTSDF